MERQSLCTISAYKDVWREQIGQRPAICPVKRKIAADDGGWNAAPAETDSVAVLALYHVLHLAGRRFWTVSQRVSVPLGKQAEAVATCDWYWLLNSFYSQPGIASSERAETRVIALFE